MWKSPQRAVETYSFDQAQLLRRRTLANPWIRHLTASFEQVPTPNTANELYETALLYGHADDLPPTVAKLSKRLRDVVAPPNVTPWHYGAAPEQAPFVLSDTVDVHDDAARLQIHRLRRLLAANPDRPFCWSELARHFLVVAEQKKAIRCMQAALQLAKRNRYLYRAATRLFVHIQDADRALRLLRSEPEVTRDPWLLAAEIATSSVVGKRSRFLDVAKQLMTSSHFKEDQVSELAAAVGTVELDHGTTKRARSLFNRSLIAPTENSLAQAQWAVEQDTKIVIPAAAWQTPASYEAKAFAARRARDWKNALQACAAWFADEPFSHRPAMMGSYLGCFHPKHQAVAEQFATAGLRCDSANIGLLNNRAVARVYLGKTEEAYADLRAALERGPARDDAHLMATLGLIAFRSGMPTLGREYYGLSIAWFLQSKDLGAVASAILYRLREEIRIDRSAIPQSIVIAQRIAKSPMVMRQPELIGMTELVIEEAQGAASTSLAPNDRPVAPASSNEFSHQASLFHVPEKAKQLASRHADFAELV
jgi:tetratricopeptide (TPR) repeat protein